MSEQAPERIWAAPSPTWADAAAGDWPSPLNKGDTEYIRADIHRAELEAVREAMKEAIKEPISAYIYDTLYKLRCPATSHSHQKTYEAAHAAMDALDLDEILKEVREPSG